MTLEAELVLFKMTLTKGKWSHMLCKQITNGSQALLLNQTVENKILPQNVVDSSIKDLT